MQMTISKETIDFLKQLKKNNNKQWFEKHREEFKKAHENFSEFIAELAKEIARFDSRVRKELLNKKTVKVFRLYRDVRFSKNKTPYKTNFGGTISPKGMESGNPGYYVHVEPGGSFLAGGLHMPEPKVLAKIRSAIAKDHQKLRKILKNSTFSREFGGLDEYMMLKTIPQGYSKDHIAADLLRFKSFIALKKVPDKDAFSKNFHKQALKTLQVLKPLNDYLAEAVR